jgi:hypothetical protein
MLVFKRTLFFNIYFKQTSSFEMWLLFWETLWPALLIEMFRITQIRVSIKPREERIDQHEDPSNFQVHLRFLFWQHVAYRYMDPASKHGEPCVEPHFGRTVVSSSIPKLSFELVKSTEKDSGRSTRRSL